MPARPDPIVTVAATLDWQRILTPVEVAAIRSVIGLSRLQVLFDVLFYTGMRYAELRHSGTTPTGSTTSAGPSPSLPWV